MVKRMWEMQKYQKILFPAIMTCIIIWHDETIFEAISIFWYHKLVSRHSLVDVFLIKLSSNYIKKKCIEWNNHYKNDFHIFQELFHMTYAYYFIFYVKWILQNIRLVCTILSKNQKKSIDFLVKTNNSWNLWFSISKFFVT